MVEAETGGCRLSRGKFLQAAGVQRGQSESAIFAEFGRCG